MKSFAKITLAVICGLLIFTVMTFIMLGGMLGAMTSGTSYSESSLPKGGVLVIDLSQFVLSEQASPADPIAMIQGTGTSTVGIWDAVRAINAAASDPAVRYIYLKADTDMMAPVQSIALLQELRASLSSFRLSGKAVVAYMDAPSTPGYYICSVADKVFLPSAAGMTPMLTGLSGQLFFIKDLLDRLGVNVQLIRHGRYKSAGEMFVRSTPSGDNLDQNQRMIDSMWESLAADIASSRGITVEALDAALGELKLTGSQAFLDEGLADEILSREELKGRLATLAVAPSYKDVRFISFPDYVSIRSKSNYKSHRKIAIIYANGEIVDGRDSRQVAGDRFCSIISKVRADSTVKAVVLRVNSPGGSVMASDKIRAEIELLRKDKPVVASYGEYAASGGYWISASCDKIFASPVTLTGSIGCFSMLPDFSGTLSDVAHVNMTSIGSNPHSDMYSLMRPLSTAETAYMQQSVEEIYSDFVSVVSTGRGLEPEYVEGIAEGRVWTGADAVEISLVDELGTLEDAVRWAAAAGGYPEVESWMIEQLPAPQTSMEMVMEMISPSENNALAGTPFELFGEAMLDWKKSSGKGACQVFARMPFALEIR